MSQSKSKKVKGHRIDLGGDRHVFMAPSTRMEDEYFFEFGNGEHETRIALSKAAVEAMVALCNLYLHPNEREEIIARLYSLIREPSRSEGTWRALDDMDVSS